MVKLENLIKNYNGFNLNVSMEIPSGTIVGLIGKNGSGKSTTIKAILGLIKPNAGQVEVFGKNAADLSPEDKEMIGVALAEGSYSYYLKLKDIVAIQAKFFKDFDAGEFLRRCQREGLPDDKLIKDYSTGMKAKLKVLLALSHKTKLLIMDEPTAGLDVEARQDILALLREYMAANEDAAILITSHIASDLEDLCDDIYLIDKGQIILHQDIDTIMNSFGIIKVDEQVFEGLDKEYIISSRNESYGKVCLTSDKQYYRENYPNIVVENSGIDDLILIMTGGK